MAFIKLPRLFGRKDLQFHVERHTAFTSPTPGEDRLQPQDSGLVVWGFKVKHDDGTTTSRTHMMGGGTGVETTPLDASLAELALMRSKLENIAPAVNAAFVDAAALAAAEPDRLAEEALLRTQNDNLKEEVVALQDQTVLHLPSEADWLRAQLQELKSQPVAELPPVEDDYEYADDIETMSERQLMGMSFD
jgi:hypothetical protein